MPHQTIKSVKYEDIIVSAMAMTEQVSGVPSERVVNGYSVRGPDLAKIIGPNILSIDLADTFIIFQLDENNNSKNYSLSEENGTRSNVVNYTYSLKIYGNASHNVAQKIYAGFKSEGVSLEMRTQGIYVCGVENPQPTNEFINNTVVPRVDLTIYFRVRYSFPEYIDGYFEALNDVNNASSIITTTDSKNGN